MTAIALSMEPQAFPFNTLLGTPHINASMRNQPSDFRVTERLGFQPAGQGEHVYLEIRKTGANTAWVADRIADHAGLRSMDVGYAGRKDRHGITTQWFSCYLPKAPAIDWHSLQIEGVELLQVTRHSAKLRPGQLECNAFELVLRHAPLSEQELAALEQRLQAVGEAGFPNYFGQQRFGRDNHNLQLADQLLRQGERLGGQRGMAISAARAWIFNQYLSGLVLAGMSPDLALTGPLIGKSRDPQPGEDALDAQLTEWVAGLRRLRARAATRPLFVRPLGLQWQQQAGETQLSFSLPPGSYATALLREIFVVEDAMQ